MNYWTTSLCLIPALLVYLGCDRASQPNRGETDSAKVIEIMGSLQDGAGHDVILDEMAAREFIPVDTVTCDDRGHFYISFESGRMAFYVLRAGPSGYITLLMVPGEKLMIKGTYGNTDHYEVEESDGSALLALLAREHKKTLDTLGQLTRKNMELQSSPQYAQLKGDLDLKFDSITSSFHQYSLDFIHRNQKSLAILIALYNLYGQGLPVFHPEKDFEVYRFVDSVLTPRYGDLEVVQMLHAQITEVSHPGEREEKVPGPAIGEIAPDFVSWRPDGDQLALSDLKGNYVLLSFWAGWSRLSREENRYLREAWTRYGTMPFRILQVSFDGNKEMWLSVIEQDELDWDHVSELRRWETPVADIYRVDKIPSNYLIDPEGRIIGMDLFGNELIENLETLFSED